MSTLRVDSIQNTSGITRYVSHAWVNFNGTGTIAIRQSGNVSSLTDNGTGDYTVTFSSAIVDADFGLSGFATNNDAGANESFVVSGQSTGVFNTTFIRITTTENTGGSTVRGDTPFVCAQVIR